MDQYLVRYVFVIGYDKIRTCGKVFIIGFELPAKIVESYPYIAFALRVCIT